MAFLFKQPQYLAFIALSPMMVIGNLFSDRRRSKRGYRQRNRLRAAPRRRQRPGGRSPSRARLPPPRPSRSRYLLLIAAAPSRRLWERTRGDDDFLALRIGTGMVPWPSDDQAARARAAADELPDAPVVLPLADCGAIGVTGSVHQPGAGPGHAALAAVLHSPREVSVTVLTRPNAPETGTGWAGCRTPVSDGTAACPHRQ